jgi:hypothetical protein
MAGGINLSWKPVTTDVSGSPIGHVTYNLYRGPAANNIVKSHIGLTGTSFTVTAGLTPGGRIIYFALTAQEGKVESAKSNVVSAVIPK